MKTTEGAVSRYSSLILFCLAVCFGQLQLFAISLGDRVQASGTINVRQTAAGTVLGTQSLGSLGVTIGGPTVASLGGTSYTWWNVNFDSGTDGWIATTGFTVVKAATPTSPSPGTTSSPGPTQASSTVTLSWGASTGATYYDLGVVDVATGSFVVNTTTTSPSYTASLTAGKTYRWNVAAGNSAGLSTYTTVIYFQTPGTKPPTPTSPTPGTTSSPGPVQASSTVTLSWGASSGATYYDLGVVDVATGSFVVNTTTTSTSYAASLTAGKTYRWNVAAGNGAGLSTYTTVIYFQTPGTKPPTPTSPTPGTTSSPGPVQASSTVTLSWGASSGATYYDLGVVDVATGSFVVNTTTTSTSYAASLTAGKTYRWNVAAGNGAGLSTYTTVIYFQTPTSVTVLGPPTLVSPGTSTSPGTSLPTTTPQFSWQAVSGADGYALYISKLNGLGGYDVVFDSSIIGGPLTGTSYTLPSGYVFSGGQYRWNMATHNGAGYGSPNASRFYFSVVTSGSTFYLSFPLPNRDATTAKINSVFDHSMASSYTADGVVVAFTGEEGRSQYGQDYVTTINGNALYGYKNSGGTSFAVNGNYAGGGSPTYLYYEGHPGIDFRTTDQSANGQINVLAAADGTAHWVVGSAYNTLWIDHGNGYTTHYLHLSSRTAADGAAVTRGQVIGVSGDAGASGSPHLHFEVHLNGVAVDPYGWQGASADPYTKAVNVNLWTAVSPPCTYSVSPTSRSHGSSTDTGSFGVTTSGGCSWSVTTGDSWVTITSSSSGSGNGSVNYSLSANAGASARTGTINAQGQIFTITQAGVSAPIGYPSATWKGPAATGNYEAGRGGNSIGKIIVHTTEGSAQSALNRFQTSGEVASAHYIISTSGVVWQVVADADTGYHCGNYAYNQQSIGIELEGYADGSPAGNFSWQTDAQFTALQNLIAWLLTQYSIPLDRAHIIGHNQVPSPGSPYPPTTQWGGASNHYDNGAWWNWRRLMTALGHAPSFAVIQVQSAASLTTLPQAGAPIIAPATVGQKFVAYDSYGGYYLVFVSGSELPQQNLPAGGEFHWDGWIPAANVTLPAGVTQLEVGGVFPNRLNIRNAAGTTGTTIIARTIDGKRYAATGNSASADGFSWREFYITTTNNAVATGWAIADNLTGISGGGGASSPTISNPKRTGTTFTLSVPTQVGFNYVLEFKNSFADANWTAVQTNSGSGGMIGLTNNGASGPSRIYRVRVQ